ncbi:putative TMhelix containing protein [Vibrio phage 168E36-1]|nr:putative TMhelix containing protein [Vibrio phage 168E36-1]
MKKLMLCLAIAFSMPAQADAIYTGGLSFHIDGKEDPDGYEYNNNHELIAIEYKSAFVATMINSYHTRSYAVGYSFSVIEAQYFNLDAVAGVIHGYTKEQNDILRMGSVNGFGSLILEANTPYVKPAVMLFGTAFVFSLKYEW